MNRSSSILLAFAIFQCAFHFSTADINLGLSDFKCPIGYSIYPHPERCELYYTCYNTKPTYLWKCRSNLVFDLVYNGCNWPEQTYCGNRTRPDTSDLTTTIQPLPTGTTHGQSFSSPEPITCPDDGFYPSSTDICISFFYTCLDGYPFSTYCPSYGVFDPVSRRCVSPNAIACKNTTSPTVPETSPTPVTTSPSAPTSVNTSPTASTSIITSPSLPASVSTDPTTPTYAYASTTAPTSINTSPTTSVAYSKTIAPTTTVVIQTTAGGSFVCPGNGSYPHPTQCSYYYTCDNGTAYLFACPTGLVFNPVGGICDWPSNVPNCKSN